MPLPQTFPRQQSEGTTETTGHDKQSVRPQKQEHNRRRTRHHSTQRKATPEKKSTHVYIAMATSNKMFLFSRFWRAVSRAPLRTAVPVGTLQSRAFLSECMHVVLVRARLEVSKDFRKVWTKRPPGDTEGVGRVNEPLLELSTQKKRRSLPVVFWILQ